MPLEKRQSSKSAAVGPHRQQGPHRQGERLGTEAPRRGRSQEPSTGEWTRGASSVKMPSSMSIAGGTGSEVAEECSACGRSGAQVTELLAARGRSGNVICDKCVRECERVIADSPTRIPGGAHLCAFCDKPEGNVAVIVGVGAKKICDECVDAFRATLDRTTPA